MLKTRVKVACILAAIILPSILLFDGVPFRFVIGLGFLFAIMETSEAFARVTHWKQDVVGTIEMVVLIIGGLFFCITASVREIVIMLVAVLTADVFAYFAGRTFGSKLITARPFPKISPNKSWEGIIAGVIGSMCMVFVTIYVMDGCSFELMQDHEYLYLGCGILAVVGDFLESAFKRLMFVKDSIDFVGPHNKFLLFAERLLGGKNGHGGYLDRLDSLAFTGAVFYLLSVLRNCTGLQ